MVFRKAYTVIPKCSIGQTQYCTQDCSICDKANFDDIIQIPIPDTTAYFVSADIDKNKIRIDEVVTVTIVMDRSIDPALLEVYTTSGIKVISQNIINHNSAEIKLTGDGSGRTGIMNIVVKYAGITRVLRTTLVETFARIVGFTSSSADIQLGNTIRLDISLNRPLKDGEPLPIVKYEQRAFELLYDVSISKTNPLNVFMLLQAKVDSGFYTITANFDGDEEPYPEVCVTISPQEIVYATDEDIYFLFPELKNQTL